MTKLALLREKLYALATQQDNILGGKVLAAGQWWKVTDIAKEVMERLK